MAISMLRPVLLAKSDMFQLNVRVPADLAGKVRNSRVTLPIGDGTVTVTDKVALSLRTRDPALAKARCAPARRR